jgi:hypothetical protein
MSLTVNLMVTQPVSIYNENITHNLASMAAKVKLTKGFNYKTKTHGDLTLYDVLWRPDEHKFEYADDIIDLLDEGYKILISDPDHFKKFNPENGWGSYGGLCAFVYEYRNACWKDPGASIEVCR